MLPIPRVDIDQLQREIRATLKRRPAGLAVFDADGTLWAPDIANRLWRRLLADRVLRSPGREALFAAMDKAGLASSGDPHEDALALFAAYFVGKVDEEIVVRIMINGLAGLSRADVQTLLRKALHQEHPRWADEAHLGMAELVHDMHAMGTRIVVCSGSPGWAVEAGIEALGLPVEKVLAGEVLEAGGWLTTDIVEPLTFREGKGRAWDKHFRERPLFAFGDGTSDLPLFERARALAVAVNPRPGLLRELDRFGTRARILEFRRTVGGRFIRAPEQDESTE